MKKISIIGIIIIILCFLFLLSSKIGTHYDIRYQSSEFKTSADKKVFQEKLEKYLFKKSYKKLSKNPKWTGASFTDKRKITFYANTINDNMKSIFYIEDSAFHDKILIITYIYAATSHPLFIDSKNEEMHDFGVKVAEKFPNLVIESDGYTTLKNK